MKEGKNIYIYQHIRTSKVNLLGLITRKKCMHRSGTLHGIRLIQVIRGIFPVIPNMHYVGVGLQGYANLSVLHEKHKQSSGLLL